MSDLPVPQPLPMPPSDNERLAQQVGGLAHRVGAFEGRMEKMENTSEKRHQENTTNIGNILTEMRNGFAAAAVANAKEQQTKWPVLLQFLALLAVVGIPCVGGLFAYINISNSRLETLQITGLAKVEAATAASLSRIDQDQRSFERETKAMVVPRDEIKMVTEFRNKMIDALEKRLEKLEGRGAK